MSERNMAEHVIDLLPAYALGCLDEEELLSVAQHLAGCERCRAELESYREAVDRLSLAAPERIPPAQLKAKVLARVAPQSKRAAPTGFWKTWLSALSGGLRGPAWSGAFALALLLVIVLGASSLVLWQQVNAMQARAPQGDMLIVHLNGTPAAPTAQGYLMIFKNEGYGTLVVEDAPQLEPGYQYQLWLIRDGKRTSGGVFSVDEHGYGTLQISSDQPLDAFASFGVTIEPAGGSLGPTGSKVLGGDS